MTSDVTVRTSGWCLVVPVKCLGMAKTRLWDSWSSPGPPSGPIAGSPIASIGALTALAREDLALAFALDTISATARCPEVRALIVVTDDPRVTHALGTAAQNPPDIDWTGADPAPIDVVPDLAAAGLNAAVRHGAAVSLREYGPIRLGALSADLPALRPSELGVVLRAAHSHDVAMVADWSGKGTTLLLAGSPAMFSPSFGAGSRARHEADGAVVLGDDLASLRRDVDTLTDLRAALALGVGPATRAETERLLDVDGAA